MAHDIRDDITMEIDLHAFAGPMCRARLSIRTLAHSAATVRGDVVGLISRIAEEELLLYIYGPVLDMIRARIEAEEKEYRRSRAPSRQLRLEVEIGVLSELLSEIEALCVPRAKAGGE